MAKIGKECDWGLTIELLKIKKVLTIQEAAFITGLSVSSLTDLVEDKRIPHYKPLKTFVVFNREELEQWLLSNKVEVSTKMPKEKKTIPALDPLPYDDNDKCFAALRRNDAKIEREKRCKLEF